MLRVSKIDEEVRDELVQEADLRQITRSTFHMANLFFPLLRHLKTLDENMTEFTYEHSSERVLRTSISLSFPFFSAPVALDRVQSCLLISADVYMRSTGLKPNSRMPLEMTILAASYRAMRAFLVSSSAPTMRRTS